MLNFENLDKFMPEAVGKYDIPTIRAEIDAPHKTEWIPFNYAKTAKHSGGIHFFVDDYQFNRLWTRPTHYDALIKRFECVLSPDFSTYTDMPMALQIYNHYRKHWLAAWWQSQGVTVYPTISWSTPESFEWCFDGEPRNSVVAVSSVGTQKDADAKRAFLLGYERMMQELTPTWVIFYGNVPEECDWNVIRVPAHYKQIEQRRKEKHGR